jgi:hypothetical protein
MKSAGKINGTGPASRDAYYKLKDESTKQRQRRRPKKAGGPPIFFSLDSVLSKITASPSNIFSTSRVEGFLILSTCFSGGDDGNQPFG